MKIPNKKTRIPSKKPLSLILLAVFLCCWITGNSRAEEKKVLYDGELTVLRGDFQELHYLIPKGTSPIRLEGNFKAVGGYYDDLRFHIFTQQEYVRWLHHRPNKPLLRVDKKKEHTFRVDVKPEETYYIVMDNFFSTVSNKKVKLQLNLVRVDRL